jgi:transcriptional regulator of arginine metabolism
MAAEQARRRRLVADCIRRGGVANQEMLRGLLEAQGVEVAQATLSRDLRDLGVVKGPGGYVLPGGPGVRAERADPLKECQRAVKAHLLEADAAGTVAVLKTAPGHAGALSVALDDAKLPGVVGVLAGDDTIFLACRSPRQAEGALRRLRVMSGLD